MIAKIKNAIWSFLLAIAEAKHERMKRTGYSMWY